MPQIRLTPNFMIIGTAACLLALPVLGDATAQTMMPVDTYGAAPYQSTSVHTLGTMRQSDMGSAQAAAPTYYAPTASSSDEILQPQQAGDIIYVTGGIGDEERTALHAVEKDYNLRLMSASHDGAFVGDTHIVIRNAKGDVMLDTNAGPLFYAKLPTGSYALEATHDGVFKKQTVSVRGTRAALVHLGW